MAALLDKHGTRPPIPPKRLDLSDRVRVLSYEAIEEVDRDFDKYGSGLSVELVASRSEQLAA